MRKVVLLLVFLLGALSLAACSGPVPKSIVITPPSKLVYDAGSHSLDLTGGTVAVKYSRGPLKKKVDLASEAVTIAPYTLLVAGTVPITVEYEGFSGTFDVTVNAVNNCSSIEIDRLPDKTSYGTNAKAQNVVLFGGMLKVHYEDKATETIPLNSKGVSVIGIDFDARRIKVAYLGRTAEYIFSVNSSERIFLTIVDAPERTTYRNSTSTSADDVDFGSGTFALSIDGTEYGIFPLKSKKVTATKLDLEKCYIEYEFDISDYSEVFTSAKGWFDISKVDVWTESIEITKIPTKRTYKATDTEVSLDGGEVIVKNNKGQQNTVSLPHANIEPKLSFDIDDYYQGSVILTHIDDVVDPIAISDLYEVNVIADSHTAASIIRHSAEMMPDFSTLKFDRIITMSQRQKELALEAADLYFSDVMGKSIEEELLSERNIVIPFAYYADWLEIAEGWKLFDNCLSDYIQGNKTEAEFLAFAGDFDEQILDLFYKYNYETLYGIVISEGNEQDMLFFEALSELGRERDNRLKPYLDGAIETAKAIQAALSNVPVTNAWTLGYNNALYRTSIKNAYDLIIGARYENLTDRDPNRMVQAVCNVLRLYRPDAMDIIYDHYYNTTKSVIDTKTGDILQPDVYALIESDAFPGLIIDLIPLLQRLMRSHCFANYTMFLSEFYKLQPMVEALAPSNYKFKAIPEVYEFIFKEAYYNKSQVDPNESGIDIAVYSIYSMVETAYYIYSSVLMQNYSSLLSDQAFQDVLKEYGEYLWKWMPTSDDWNTNPYPHGNEELGEDFEQLSGLFMGLSFVQQGFMLNVLDVCYYVREGSYYSLMAEAYLAPYLTPNEHKIFTSTISAFVPMSYMVEAGLTSELVSEYLRRMQILIDVYDSTVPLSPLLEQYIGDMLDVCLSNYEGLKTVDDNMHGIIDRLANADLIWQIYVTSRAADDGFKFVHAYKQLEDAIQEWTESSENHYEELLGTIELGDEPTILDQILVLRAAYELTYKQFEGDELFQSMYEVFEYMSQYENYIETPDFFAAMEDIIDLFRQKTPSERLNYLTFVRDVLIEEGIAYLENGEGMTVEELESVPFLILAYHSYLTLEYGDPASSEYTNAGQNFTMAMDEAISLFNAMGEPSLKVEEWLVPLYDFLDNYYKTDFAVSA